mmetsp:Transcript_62697/g.70978  ORF Transcript_62697/g.70978 Transcript_62697/m.70978 type:complete len:348 (+) Transcript_62697:100-1143(+)
MIRTRKTTTEDNANVRGRLKDINDKRPSGGNTGSNSISSGGSKKKVFPVQRIIFVSVGIICVFYLLTGMKNKNENNSMSNANNNMRGRPGVGTRSRVGFNPAVGDHQRSRRISSLSQVGGAGGGFNLEDIKSKKLNSAGAAARAHARARAAAGANKPDDDDDDDDDVDKAGSFLDKKADDDNDDVKEKNGNDDENDGGGGDDDDDDDAIILPELGTPRNSNIQASEKNPSECHNIQQPVSKDVCFGYEGHPGTRFFRFVVKEVAADRDKNEEYKPEIYKLIKKKLKGRRYFKNAANNDDVTCSWTEASNLEIRKELGKAYDEAAREGRISSVLNVVEEFDPLTLPTL